LLLFFRPLIKVGNGVWQSACPIAKTDSARAAPINAFACTLSAAPPASSRGERPAIRLSVISWGRKARRAAGHIRKALELIDRVADSKQAIMYIVAACRLGSRIFRDKRRLLAKVAKKWFPS
jgi:hypothetical protein